MTERVDAFKLPDKSFELPSWDFENQGRQVKAWREYFDMQQFTSGWDRGHR